MFKKIIEMVVIGLAAVSFSLIFGYLLGRFMGRYETEPDIRKLEKEYQKRISSTPTAGHHRRTRSVGTK